MAPIRPILRASDITEQQWRVLRVLDDADDAVDASALADAALLHPPSVTRILKQLVDRDLVERGSDDADGRRALLRLTRAGHALVARNSEQVRDIIDLHARAFGARRLKAMMAEIRAFMSTINDLDAVPKTGSIKPTKPRS